MPPGQDLAEAHRLLLRQDIPATARPGSLDDAGDTAPRQLPMAVRHFTGRQGELAALAGLLSETETAGGTVVISAIDGMAGVGKTALAVHAAHQMASKFPDGQLFIDMHGYTQSHPPRSAGEALEAFLRALGVPPQQVPQDIDERAALYRQRLASTRTLILLDNANSEEQVRPLLPGAAGCLVLVTSRKRLKGLYDAYPLALDVLPEADAVALLHAVAGPERVQAGEPALAEIVELCGRLPLALRIAGALLCHRPAWSAGYLAGVLTDQRQRVTALSDGERDLGAVFDLSYTSLTDAQRHLFRTLGLLPGPDTDAYGAAALTGTDLGTAARLLEDLVDHNLLISHAPGRYRLHDLLRTYARALAERDPARDRDAALDRLLDYYQHTAARADTLVTPYPRHAPQGPEPAHAPTLADPDSAWTWLRTERANLFAALQHATACARDERIITLTAGLATLLLTDGPWAHAITLHSTAAITARHRWDQLNQAHSLFHLGDIRGLTGDSAGAARDLQEALRLYRVLGDRLGQGNALNWRGHERLMACDYQGAARDLQEALRLYRAMGEQLGQANALTRLGQMRMSIGDYQGAARDLQEALRLCRDLGDQRGEAYVLYLLGDVRGLTGDSAGAARDLQEALRLYRDLGDRNGEGCALGSLGKMQILTGDYPGAAKHLEAALDLFRRIGARGNEAWTLNHYAALFAATGDHARALSLYDDALYLARETCRLDEEALALEGTGECHLHAGHTKAGISHLNRALDIFRRLAQTPDADRLQARLAQLTKP